MGEAESGDLKNWTQFRITQNQVVCFENHAEWRFVLFPLVCRALSAHWRSVGAVAPERVVASFLCSRLVSCTCALLLDVHLDAFDRTHSRLIQNSHIDCTIFNIL